MKKKIVYDRQTFFFSPLENSKKYFFFRFLLLSVYKKKQKPTRGEKISVIKKNQRERLSSSGTQKCVFNVYELDAVRNDLMQCVYSDLWQKYVKKFSPLNVLMYIRGGKRRREMEGKKLKNDESLIFLNWNWWWYVKLKLCQFEIWVTRIENIFCQLQWMIFTFPSTSWIV